jgi:hypothetical protein
VPTETTEKLGALPPGEFQRRLDEWISDNAALLHEYEPDESRSVEEATSFPRRYQNLLYDAGGLASGNRRHRAVPQSGARSCTRA